MMIFQLTKVDLEDVFMDLTKELDFILKSCIVFNMEAIKNIGIK